MTEKAMDKNSTILHKIREYGDTPGVYLMKNDRGRIIYIGKAKSLRKRIMSYFSGEKDLKTQFLLQRVADIDVIITRTEDEALITENNLIKKWQPKYNINLKDGKTYPVIRLTNEKYPRLFRTRRLVLDGSRYFGPYPSAEDIDTALHVIEKIFPLRKCKGALKKKDKPCLYYHIGRCPGICAGMMSDDDYAARVDKVIKLLEGDTKEITEELTRLMSEAAQELNYEKAAILRDQLAAIGRLRETQMVSSPHSRTEDCIGMATRDNFASFVIVKLIEGKIFTRETFHTQIYGTREDALLQFIWQYYARSQVNPEAIWLPLEIDRSLTDTLAKNLGMSIYFPDPADQTRRAVWNLAQANAEQALRVSRFDGLVELKTILDLPDVPVRIEGFDIAHLEGTYTVASMVCFIQGQPEKESYRRFKIKTLGGAVDDFEAIREVVARRYMRVLAEDDPKPDLILIDGGKGQLASARGILEKLGLGHIPVIGLAKKREEIFMPHQVRPIVLPHTSPALRVLVAVRDESHRFATGFHKLLRDRDTASSALEKIKGIGKKKAQVLIMHFRSLDNLLKADWNEITRVARIKNETVVELINTVKDLLGEG